MYVKTITLKTEPPTQVQLFFKNHENASKGPEPHGTMVIFKDDYGTEYVFEPTSILSSHIMDHVKHLEANEDIQFEKLAAELKGEQRLSGAGELKAHVMKKQIRNMPPQAFQVPPNAA